MPRSKPSLIRITVLALLYVGSVFAQRERLQKPASAPTDIMSFEEYVKKRHPVPFILRLSAGKGRLVYFGAKHTFDPNEPEIARMEHLWKRLEPDVAFFEGADPENVPPVVKTRDEVRRNGEPSFVVFLAQRDNVLVRTLEPAKKDEIVLLLNKYTPEQIELFYVLRQIPQFRNSKQDQSIEKYTEEVLNGLSWRPRLKGAPRTLSEFEASVQKLLPKLKDWRDVPQTWFDPAPPQPLTYLNDISRQLSEFRDRHMLTLLAEQVAQGKRVFAAVGASHVVMQERALRAAIRPGNKT